MQFSAKLKEAKLIRRYKRFLADIRLPDNSERTIHCPNTGSMRSCSQPGSRICYSTSDNPKRKYPKTLETVHHAGVKILVYQASVSPSEIRLTGKLPFRFPTYLEPAANGKY